MLTPAVAPLVGAWIEILTCQGRTQSTWSLLSWERGLKLIFWIGWLQLDSWSLLSWERGLKSAGRLLRAWSI